MKNLSNILVLIIVVLCGSLTGCKSGETASSNPANKAAAQPPASPANANQSQSDSSPGAKAAAVPNEATKPVGKAELIGTYESREVHDKGVVTVISQLKTLWHFSQDGTYSRTSEVKGKPYHSDSGSFRIEPPDKLILSIQVTGLQMQRKVQNPPLSKTHKFELSADGEELRLISGKGSVGIFRRVAKPKGQ